MRAILIGLLILVSGCTSRSVEQSISYSRQVRDVNAQIVQNQHDAIVTLLFRQTVHRLVSEAGANPQLAETIVRETFEEFGRVEFLGLQHARAEALHLMTVDNHLYDSQGILNLGFKFADEWWQKAKAGFSAASDKLKGDGQ